MRQRTGSNFSLTQRMFGSHSRDNRHSQVSDIKSRNLNNKMSITNDSKMMSFIKNVEMNLKNKDNSKGLHELIALSESEFQKNERISQQKSQRMSLRK